MSHPGYLRQVALECAAEFEEVAVALLEAEFECPASAYHDFKTGRTKVSVYVSAGRMELKASVASIRSRIGELSECGLFAGGVRVEETPVRKEDWSESWKKHFRPYVAGRKVLIRPSWSKRRPRVGQVEVVLDPGLSFGTGQHATTRYCLERLAKLRRPLGRQSFLDLGTGTGILAIAAAKLGYRPIEAIDFDAACVANAGANVRRNRVQGRVDVRQGDVCDLPARPVRRFDLVCANLMHDLLIAQSRRIAVRVAPGGCLVVAGILHAQFPAVRQAMEREGLVFKDEKSESEWTSGSFGLGT